jgi:hypothetical protein
MRTAWQNRILHALLGKLNIDQELKEDLVLQYTNGREKRSSGLTVEECNALIGFLKRQAGERPHAAQASSALTGTSSNPSTPLRGQGGGKDPKKMQYKCLSICHEMGWKLPNGKIDIARVDEFCLKRGHAHKKLNKYEYKELPLLITQFEKMLREFYAKG